MAQASQLHTLLYSSIAAAHLTRHDGQIDEGLQNGRTQTHRVSAQCLHLCNSHCSCTNCALVSSFYTKAPSIGVVVLAEA